MFENIKNIFKRSKKRELLKSSSKDTAKERLHLVLMQDRANVSADFLDLMRKEIIEVIKKYIDIDEEAMDVRLGSETNEDGTQGAPALYANIPIINIKDETRKMSKTNQETKITPELKIMQKLPKEDKIQKEEPSNEIKKEKVSTEKKIAEEEKKEATKEKKENEPKENKKEVNQEKSKEEVKQEQTTKKDDKEQENKKIKEEKKDEK